MLSDGSGSKGWHCRLAGVMVDGGEINIPWLACFCVGHSCLIKYAWRTMMKVDRLTRLTCLAGDRVQGLGVIVVNRLVGRHKELNTTMAYINSTFFRLGLGHVYTQKYQHPLHQTRRVLKLWLGIFFPHISSTLLIASKPCMLSVFALLCTRNCWENCFGTHIVRGTNQVTCRS